MTSVLLGDTILMGNHATLARLQRNRAEKVVRPRSFSFGGISDNDPSLQIVAALSADEKRALAELMPKLPAELGGGSTDFLARDLETIRLDITLPPTLTATAYFQLRAGDAQHPANPDSIKNLTAFIKRIRDILLASDWLQHSTDPMPFPITLRPLLQEILTPKSGSGIVIQGAPVLIPENQIALQMTPDQGGQIARMFASSLTHSMQIARDRTTAGIIRGLVQSCLIYSQDNGDKYPDSLDVLVKLGMVKPTDLVNPNDPRGRKFVYQPLAKAEFDAGMPLIWEQTDDPSVPIAVGFEDGHVDMLRSRKEFDDLLKATADRRAKRLAATQKATP